MRIRGLAAPKHSPGASALARLLRRRTLRVDARHSGRGFILALLLFPLFIANALAAIQFPELTGRVVDEAGLLSEPVKTRIAQKLAAHESATSNQVVVVTLKSLDGYDIADYGYQLGRHWGIGQKDRDNGVLFIVAPNDRKVRIEVGYGLEGNLTDALSADIIQNRVLPRFRAGDFQGGIAAGVDAILAAIDGAYEPLADAPGETSWLDLILLVLVVWLILWFIFNSGGGGGTGLRRGGYYPMDYDGRWGGGGYYGGGGWGGSGGGLGGGWGGGFGGGGGGFGGGGASGGW